MEQHCKQAVSGLARTAALVLAAAFVLAGCAETTPAPPLKQPKIAIELPEESNTPDGMVLDTKTGDILLSVPNFNDDKHPAKIVRIDTSDRMTDVVTLPPHPDTKKAGPLGIDIAPDGNLYVADNQSFGTEELKSRLWRVVMEDGKAARVEVVAVGFFMANAVACRGQHVYVTESKFDPKATPIQSGVYRFAVSELKADDPVQLQPGGNDPHLVAKFETKNPDWVGANGMGFDADGNMFVCNFGDAQLLKFTFDSGGKVASQTVFAEGQGMLSADGMKVHPKTGDIYIADFLGNAVHKVDARTGKVTTLAKNGLTDGTGGLLDRPSEVCLRGNKCYVANIDLDKMADNTYDAPHTISVIELDE